MDLQRNDGVQSKSRLQSLQSLVKYVWQCTIVGSHIRDHDALTRNCVEVYVV